MNQFPSKAIIDKIKNTYPKGTRVELISMNDVYTKLKPGDFGTVEFVDDIGSIFVKWDNGSTLGIVYGIVITHRRRRHRRCHASSSSSSSRVVVVRVVVVVVVVVHQRQQQC